MMHDVVFHATKDVQKLKYIFVNYDELNITNNQSWLYVHVYVTKEWKRVPFC
jgi:hypothetical protein